MATASSTVKVPCAPLSPIGASMPGLPLKGQTDLCDRVFGRPFMASDLRFYLWSQGDLNPRPLACHAQSECPGSVVASSWWSGVSSRTAPEGAGRKRFCVRVVGSSAAPCRTVRRTMYLSRKALAGYVSGYAFRGPLPLAVAQEVMLIRPYNRRQRPVRCDVGLVERAARRAGQVDRNGFQVDGRLAGAGR